MCQWDPVICHLLGKGEAQGGLKTLYKLVLYENFMRNFCLQYCIRGKVSCLKIAFFTKYKMNIILNNLAWIAKHWIKIYFLVQGKGKWNKWCGAKGYSSLVNKIHSCSGSSHMLIYSFSGNTLNYRVRTVC